MIKNKSPFGFLLKLIGLKPTQVVYDVGDAVLNNKNDSMQEEMVDAKRKWLMLLSVFILSL